MRATQTVNIGLGTISIVSRIYVATDEDKGISFHEVHAEDGARIRRRKVCEKCGTEVKGTDIVKGFEFNGRMLTFTEDEIDALKPVTTRAMTINYFSRLSEIPIIAMGKAYFVGTASEKDGGNGDTFALLRESMRKSGEVAVVSWVSNQKEHLGILMPYAGDALMLKTVIFADQIRDASEVEVLASNLPEATVAKGVKVVKALSKPFDISKFHETYSESLAELIKARAKGKEIPMEKLVKPKTAGLDSELDNLIGMASDGGSRAIATTEKLVKPIKKEKTSKK